MIVITEDVCKNGLTKVIIVMHSNRLCHLKHSLLFVEAIHSIVTIAICEAMRCLCVQPQCRAILIALTQL